MSGWEWLPQFLDDIAETGGAAPAVDTAVLSPARLVALAPGDWARAGYLAAAAGCRWAGLWGDPGNSDIAVYACLVRDGDYLALMTRLSADRLELASHAPFFPGANRMERHLHDLLGIVFSDHPDARRWTRHQAWPADRHPLRPDFPLDGISTRRAPADADYPFVRVQGGGVNEIPVGPVHAGIIEPGHFRFQAVGEDILNLEERLGYVHKGIEKIAVGRDAAGLARLAGRVSGDSTVAHAWAACQAMERAAHRELPPRAHHLRALMAERERVANHLGDIGAICNDVGFTFVHMQCARLREEWQRRSLAVFGHRLMMDVVVPGGVACDIDPAAVDALRLDHRRLRQAIEPVFDVATDHSSLDDRLVATGRLEPAEARRLGCTGYVGKASGQAFDVRRDGPYAPYDELSVTVPVAQQGDVASRMQVRMDEIRISLDLMDRLLDRLPGGETVAVGAKFPSGGVGLGIVEGWRGEIVTFIRFGDDGRIARFFPRDPSWFTWLALERLIDGNIVPDFPVCNKSVNASYSGHDL